MNTLPCVVRWEGTRVFAKFMNGLFPGPHTVQLHSCLFSLSLNYVVCRYCQLLLPGTLKWNPFKYWQSSPSGFPRQHWVSERSSSRLLLWFSQPGGISPLNLYKHAHFPIFLFVCFLMTVTLLSGFPEYSLHLFPFGASSVFAKPKVG